MRKRTPVVEDVFYPVENRQEKKHVSFSVVTSFVLADHFVDFGKIKEAGKAGRLVQKYVSQGVAVAEPGLGRRLEPLFLSVNDRVGQHGTGEILVHDLSAP